MWEMRGGPAPPAPHTPIQFPNSLSPPEFPAIQGVVVEMTISKTPRLADMAIYTDGSFSPTSLVAGVGIALIRDGVLIDRESLPIGVIHSRCEAGILTIFRAYWIYR